MKKVEICVGDEFTVDFMLNRNGGKPVCRIEGMVGFLDKSVKDFVTPSSTWVVSVTRIAETFVLVKPLYKVRSPKENQVILQEKLDSLQSKLDSLRIPKLKKAMEKNGYQYKSFAELKAEKEASL
jgi:hypothetical protein